MGFSLGNGWYRPVMAFGLAVLIVVGMRVLSYRKIGGITGDVLGATAELVEVVTLIPWMSKT